QEPSSLFKVYEQGKSRVKQMLAFIKSEKINIQEIVNYLKDEFSERNCIITNSKDNEATTKEKTTEEQQQLLNSLEDRNNHIRAIFTVKRLTEGCDVLNLFDIIRLYEGRDEGHQNGQRVAGQATVQEIQLIGRGVRYFPFVYNEQEKNKRKFDNDLENPLRVLEEFYYHSDDDVRYLDELKRELKNKGFIQDNREVKKFALKDEFKQSNFFKEIKIWKNERLVNPEKRKRTLAELEKKFIFEYKTKEFTMKEQQIVLDKEKDELLAESLQKNRKTISAKLKDLEKHIVAKAINKKATKDLSLLCFDNLKNELNIDSIDEIFTENFIGNFRINIITSKDKKTLDDISNDEKLTLLLEFFEIFSKRLKEISNPYKGSEKFELFSFEDIFGKTKEKNVIADVESINLEAELKQQKWYVLDAFNGTSEEIALLEFVKSKIGNLEEKYSEMYLLRNEEVYKIYDFDEGRGFEPDFLLFLMGKENNLYFQIFIESKGSQFLDQNEEFKEGKEGWKEKFLQDISNKYGYGQLLKMENQSYRLFGLPLFNNKGAKHFEEVFEDTLLSNDSYIN
ncbi:MAG: type III restriction endonuclease, partial [bacterium]